MSTTASPPDVALLLDLDIDVDIEVPLPAGTYLAGGASGWTLYFEITNPTTGTVLLSKTSGGGGIVVTTAGGTLTDAVFTISLQDTDLIPATFRKNTSYNWKFKRNDPGSEVDIAAGQVRFRR